MDIDLLVILNTAYLLYLSSNKSIQDIRLPAPEWETWSTATNNKNAKMQKKPPSSLRASLRLAQSYSFLISDNGQYILRLDAKSLVNTHAGDPTVHSVTAIEFDKTRKTSHIIGRVGSHDAGMNINSCSIHPALPLALF